MKKYLLLLMAPLLFTGCFDVEQVDDLCRFNSSTKVSSDLIIDAFKAPFQSIDITNKKPGEWVYYQRSLRTQTSQNSTPISEIEMLIANAQLSDDGLSKEYNIIKTVRTVLSNGDVDEVQTSIPYKVPLPLGGLESTSAPTTRGPFKPSENKLNVAKTSCSSKSLIGYSLHKLQRSRSKDLAPPLVQKRNCPGLENCEMDVYNVEFDEVIVQDDQENTTQVIHHKLKFSPDIPFLNYKHSNLFSGDVNPEGLIYNGLLSHCMEYWAKTEEGPVFVSDCSYLMDYQYGE